MQNLKSPPNENWVRCKECGHKLMRVVDVKAAQIEIKCHSCKAINTIHLKEEEK